MSSNFFSMLFRMKYINRWSLMRNIRHENLTEHSLEVAFIAHGLALIGKHKLKKDIDENKIAVIAMFHDIGEIITGDLPTPIKYYDDNIRKVYKEIEEKAEDRLLNFLPNYLKDNYRDIFDQKNSKIIMKYIKAADKISALIKCIDEEQQGNKDFIKAKISIEDSIESIGLPEAKIFLDEFLEGFYTTLDEQKK